MNINIKEHNKKFLKLRNVSPVCNNGLARKLPNSSFISIRPDFNSILGCRYKNKSYKNNLILFDYRAWCPQRHSGAPFSKPDVFSERNLRHSRRGPFYKRNNFYLALNPLHSPPTPVEIKDIPPLERGMSSMGGMSSRGGCFSGFSATDARSAWSLMNLNSNFFQRFLGKKSLLRCLTQNKHNLSGYSFNRQIIAGYHYHMPRRVAAFALPPPPSEGDRRGAGENGSDAMGTADGLDNEGGILPGGVSPSPSVEPQSSLLPSDDTLTSATLSPTVSNINKKIPRFFKKIYTSIGVNAAAKKIQKFWSFDLRDGLPDEFLEPRLLGLFVWIAKYDRLKSLMNGQSTRVKIQLSECYKDYKNFILLSNNRAFDTIPDNKFSNMLSVLSKYSTIDIIKSRSADFTSINFELKRFDLMESSSFLALHRAPP